MPGLVYTHYPPTVGLLAGWLPGATFSGRAVGRLAGHLGTLHLDFLSAVAGNGPLEGAHVLPRFSSVAAMGMCC